ERHRHAGPDGFFMEAFGRHMAVAAPEQKGSQSQPLARGAQPGLTQLLGIRLSGSLYHGHVLTRIISAGRNGSATPCGENTSGDLAQAPIQDHPISIAL